MEKTDGRTNGKERKLKRKYRYLEEMKGRTDNDINQWESRERKGNTDERYKK